VRRVMKIQQYIEWRLAERTDDPISDIFIVPGKRTHLKTARSLSVDTEKNETFEDDIIDFISNACANITKEEISDHISKEGALNFKYTVYPRTGRGLPVHLRCCAFLSMGRFCCNVRILPSEVASIDELNVESTLLRQLKSTLQAKNGLVIISGPTGSGKSTTIASCLKWLTDNYNRVLLTVEDPIEFVFKDDSQSLILQKQVGIDTPSFAAGINDALRQAPDVIFVGEVRSPQEFAAAIMAAETGHLVVTTMHTPSIDAIPGRIINSFPPEQAKEMRVKLASVLKLLCTQRLIGSSQGIGAYYEFLSVEPAIKALILKSGDSQISSYINTQNPERINNVLLGMLLKGVIDEQQALAHATDVYEMSEKIAKAQDSSPLI